MITFSCLAHLQRCQNLNFESLEKNSLDWGPAGTLQEVASQVPAVVSCSSELAFSSLSIYNRSYDCSHSSLQTGYLAVHIPWVV